MVEALVLNGVDKEAAEAAVSTALLNAENTKTTFSTQTLTTALHSLGVALKAASPFILVGGLMILSSTFSDVESNVGNASKLIVAAILLIGTITVFAIKMANTAIWGFMSSNSLGWILLAITAVVVAIKAIVEAIIGFANASTVAKEKAIDAAKETKEAWEDAKEALDEINEELETARDRFEELQELSDRGTITLVEQEELDKLRETIALLETEKAVRAEQEALSKQNAEKAASDAVDAILNEKLSDAFTQEDNTFWNGVGRSLASVFSLGLSDWIGGYGISDWTKAPGGSVVNGKHYTTTQEYVDEILEKMKNGEEITDQQTEYLSTFYATLQEQQDMLTYHSGDNLEQWQKDANEAYNTYWEYIHKLNIANGKVDSVWNHVLNMERFDGVQEKLTELANAGDVSYETIKSLYDTNDAFREMIDYLIELGIFSWEDSAKVSGLVNQIGQMANAGEAAQRQVDRLAESISAYKKDIGTLKAAIDEYNNSGTVSAETYNKVIALNEDYADLFDFSSGKISIAADEVDRLVEELIAEYGATLTANGATEAQITQMVALANSLSDVKEEAADVVDAIKDLADILQDAVDGTEMTVFETWELLENYPELATAITKTTNGYILEEAAVRELIKAKAELLEMEASEARMAARDNLINNTDVNTANNVDKVFADYYNNNGTNIKSFEDYIAVAGESSAEGLQEYVEAIISDNAVNNVMNSLIEDMKNPDTLLKTETEENPISNAFDELEAIYSGRLQELDYLTNTYNNAIKSLENQGYDVPASYYEKLKEVEEEKIVLLGEELTALTAKFQEAINVGEIEEGSQEFYDMNNAINSVKESIQASNLALQEYSNTIRDLEWKKFDDIQDEIKKITDESEFLLDLLDDKDMVDDKGKLTEHGNAAMGLHGMNYNVYMEQARRYADEITKIEQELASDKYNQDLIDRKDELLELQRESVLAAEEEKQAMIDLVTEGIEAELDALDELIDKYKDALDEAKDLYDYQNKVSDATEEISRLQKMIIAYENDNSEEMKAQIQKLKVELQEAQEELQETEYDQFIADQKKLLDNLYDDYETILNRRLDDVSTLITDSINAINTNATDIKTTLETTASSVGTTLSDKMGTIWTVTDECKSVVSTYSGNFDTAAGNVNGNLTTIDGTISSGVTTISSTLSTIDADIGSVNTNISSVSTGIGTLAGKLDSIKTAIGQIDNSGNASNPDGVGGNPSGNAIPDSAPNTIYTDPTVPETPTEDKKTTSGGRWTSYQDAVDAGYSNILGASGSEKARAKQQYGSYQNYLDAMYYKYMGKNPDGVSTIPQKIQTTTTTTTQPREKMVEYAQTGLRIGTKSYTESKYNSKLKVIDGVTYLSTHENGAQWSSNTDLYVKEGEGYTVTKRANGKVEMDWHSFKPVYQLQQYKNGGLADFTGLAWMDGTKSKPEAVLNAEDTKNFIALRDILAQLASDDIGFGNPLYSSFAPMSYGGNIPNFGEKLAQILNSYGETNIQNHFEITIPIEKVEDYNDFVTQLRDDPKFEKMVQAMTLGRLNGGSPNAKYNYSWKNK